MMFRNRGHFRELLAGSEEKIASNIFAARLRCASGAEPAIAVVTSSSRAANQLTSDQLRAGDCLTGSNIDLPGNDPWPDTDDLHGS